MGERQVKVYDPEGDYLEVDKDGNALGFSILGVGSLKGTPIQAALS